MTDTSETKNGSSFRKFPYSITPLDPTINQQLLRDFQGEKDGFVQIGPQKYLFPQSFTKYIDRIYNFEARPDDVWIVTCPRSGTTMMQELIWLVTNDFDYGRAQREDLFQRTTFFEMCSILNEKFVNEKMQNLRDQPELQNVLKAYSAPHFDRLEKEKSPRVIKTHLPFSLLPPSVLEKRSRLIYITRNPKDVAVSWYHLNRYVNNHGYVNDFAQFWDYFERGLTIWSPYWEHVKEGWAHRDDPNVLFLLYEDIIKDMSGAIGKIGDSLNKNISDEESKRLIDHMNIENFRSVMSDSTRLLHEAGIVQSDDGYIRTGKISGKKWEAEYTPELMTRAEAWISKNLQGITLTFPE